MLGYRDEFRYMECSNCGCLQLIDIPNNLAMYYPSNYYSLDDSPAIHFQGKIKSYLKSKRDYFLITGAGLLGRIIQLLYPNKSIEMPNFRKVAFKINDKILDVGSGAGIIPYVFFNAGFKKIEGIDPFLKEDISYANGLKISKGDFHSLTTKGWDKIMYNHSFEHLTDPQVHLQKAFDLLNEDGKCIIRIPTVSSYAWKKYGTNWVQLDAPRHIFLHSIKSLTILAENNGFEVASVSYESTAFQFLGSEQYMNNISLKGDNNSYFTGNQSLFTSVEIKNFESLAIKVNKEQQGDSIAVVLTKKNS